METYIPENEYKIPEGFYGTQEIVNILRQFKSNPDAISYIADMLEE